jgi:DNA-binding transcriptional LysR family regulator
MDRLEAMSIVLAVVEAGSLSAAARRLNTPPATASRRITELEEHLHAKLFDRSARKLTLTNSGLSYVTALKRISPICRKPTAPRQANSCPPPAS